MKSEHLRVAIAAQLAAMEGYYDLDYSNIGVWWPSQERVEGLVARMKFQDAMLVADDLKEMEDAGYMYNRCMDKDKLSQEKRATPPTNCVAAHAQCLQWVQWVRGI